MLKNGPKKSHFFASNEKGQKVLPDCILKKITKYLSKMPKSPKKGCKMNPSKVIKNETFWTQFSTLWVVKVSPCPREVSSLSSSSLEQRLTLVLFCAPDPDFLFRQKGKVKQRAVAMYLHTKYDSWWQMLKTFVVFSLNNSSLSNHYFWPRVCHPKIGTSEF